MLFLNDDEDGTVNYEQMITEVDRAIIQGVENLMEYFDPGTHKRAALGERMYHPAYRALEATRLALAQQQGFSDVPTHEHFEYQESHAHVCWDHIQDEQATEIEYEIAAAD